MRFFKRGPITVVKTGLDVRDSLITDTDEKLQVGYEARAIRPWEEFDEGIIRWTIRAFVAASIGNFGGIQLTVNGSGPNFTAADAVPRGSLFLVDEVKNTSVNPVRLHIGALTTGLISAVPADYTDARWGPRQAIPPVRAVSGVVAAVSGEEINYVSSTERWQREGLFIAIAQQIGEPLGTDQDRKSVV